MIFMTEQLRTLGRKPKNRKDRSSVEISQGDCGPQTGDRGTGDQR
jgi:hypothetical protein